MMPLPIMTSILACLTAIPSASAANDAPRPNVILIMADDLGYADTRFNGNGVVHTPHLDALARRGMIFERFYAAAPVCSPTRGSCLTGRHPLRYGVNSANSGHMPDEEITLAEVLRDAGYATGHFGKWHLGTLSKTVKESNRGGPRGVGHYAPPWEHGFDTCFSTEAKTPTYDPMWKPRNTNRNTWWNPVDHEEDAIAYGTHYWTSEDQMVNDNLRGDDSRVIMDRAVAFMKNAIEEDQPFFTVIWFHSPHLPVVAAEQYTTMYEGSNQYTQHYYGCITAMDEQVGRLIAMLDEVGAMDNTMLWFCSDNGPEGKAGDAPGSAGLFRGRKRDLYEGGIRVPAFVVWPGRVQAETRTRAAAITSDYLPTIMAALDLPAIDDRKIDGENIMPMIKGQSQARTSPIGFHFQHRKAWMDGDDKAISTDGEDEWQLYNLKDDPFEKNNLFEHDPQRAHAMREAWEAWKKTF